MYQVKASEVKRLFNRFDGDLRGHPALAPRPT